MSDYVNKAFNLLNALKMWEWFAVMGVVLMIGFFCMRGFGSRSNY